MADEYDVLFDQDPVTGEIVPTREAKGLEVDDVLAELGELIDSAVDFMQTELLPDWQRAEEFYDGDCDLTIIEGRSNATETVFRDAVRSVKPNVMRTFTQYHQLVEFVSPDNTDFGMCAIAEKQSDYANTLFWNNDGYIALSDITHNTLVKRSGILKTSRIKTVEEEFVAVDNVAEDQLQLINEMPDFTIVSVEESDSYEDPELGGVTALYHVEVAIRREGGKNLMQSVDLLTFFVDDNATTPENARVIGERRNVTVGEAISMGLEYDDWLALDEYDAGEDAGRGEEEARRGVSKDSDEETVDDSGHIFLLTEVYVRYDLDGTGVPQLYRFMLGGTTYEYIDHERVEENPYSVCNGDPLPNAFFGRSLMDVLDEDQNTQTALLRETVDNASLSNNRRLAVHDTLVNMADVMNNAMGAPIRVRAPGQIQEIGTTSNLGTLLPLLQYLRQQSEIKAGTTNAAMGLDPDALQSTDKEAVQNTIQLAQGQIDLFCRNIAETGLRSAFKKLLKLNLRYPDKGKVQSVFEQLFDPNMAMRVRIGLGTGNISGRIAALNQVIQEQKSVIETYGPANPLCTPAHVLRSLTDLGSLMGLHNMGRYFNQITPDVEQQLAQLLEQKMAQAQGEPPSVAVEKAEAVRAQGLITSKQMDNEQKDKDREAKSIGDLAKLLMEDDFKRDQLAQQLEIESAKQIGGMVDKAAVQQAQEADRDYDFQKSLLQIHGANYTRVDQKQAAAEPVRMPQQQPQQQQPMQQPQQPQQPV